MGGFCGPGLSVITSVHVLLGRIVNHVASLTYKGFGKYNVATSRRKRKWMFVNSW